MKAALAAVAPPFEAFRDQVQRDRVLRCAGRTRDGAEYIFFAPTEWGAVVVLVITVALYWAPRGDRVRGLPLYRLWTSR